jgi:hypothetical protein
MEAQPMLRATIEIIRLAMIGAMFLATMSKSKAGYLAWQRPGG